MKQEYIKPEMSCEVLLKADVLTLSEQTDNNFVQSNRLLKEDLLWEKML